MYYIIDITKLKYMDMLCVIWGEGGRHVVTGNKCPGCVFSFILDMTLKY